MQKLQDSNFVNCPKCLRQVPFQKKLKKLPKRVKSGQKVVWLSSLTLCEKSRNNFLLYWYIFESKENFEIKKKDRKIF